MKYLLLVLVSVISLESLCQVRELRFRTLSIENGLPENYPITLLQDRYGYIWFGTQNGLVRYDGYNVKVYNLETADKKEKTYRSIRKIYEDSKGKLWVGTNQQGLFLYNRSTDNFTEFVHMQKGNGSKKDDVRFIAEDEKGHIWTLNWDGREKGFHLDQLNYATGAIKSFDSFSTGSNYIPSKTLKYLYGDSKKRIWVGSANGLFLFDAQKQRFTPYFTNSDSTKRTIIYTIYEAPSQPGILWLSQENKDGVALAAFNTNTGQVKSYKNIPGDATSIAADSVLTIFEDRSKNLWTGTTKGLSLLNRATGKFIHYRSDDNAKEPFANYLPDIKEGRNGELWILSGKGLMHLSSPDGKLTRHIADPNIQDALPANTLSSSLIDRNGVLWVGARGHGLLRLNEQRSQFDFITTTVAKDSYPGGALGGLDRLKNGNYLVTTSKGLFEADSLLKFFKEIPVTTDRNIASSLTNVKVDEQGFVWIGSVNNGLFKYDPKSKKVTRFLHDSKDSTSISHNTMRVLYLDRKLNFWVGTYGGGLCKIDRKTGKFKRYPYIINEGETSPNGALDDDQVSSILEDNKGQLWIGTNNGGLNKLDLEIGRFTSYFDKDKGLNCVLDIYEDSKGRLWVGTYLWGLFLFDRQTGTSKRFTEKEGLVYDNVFTIKEDGKGNIWLGSGRGFSILNPADFSIKTITARTGLPSARMANPLKYTTPDGDWLFTTMKGILRFNPDNLIINKTPPEIILQSISYNKNGETDSLPETILIHDQKKIEFAYNENRIIFQYAGIHYTNPSLNQYKYKLDGYDKDWIDGKNQRTITYTNLSPGKYTFHVKAASSDGIWSEKDATIDLIIHPPWWQTWWAYIIYAFIVAAGIRAYISYRSHQLQRENKILEEKVVHRTNQLQKSIEDLKTTQTQLIQSEKMASLGELTAGIAHEIQNPLNFVNNFSDVNKELIAEMKDEIEKENFEEVKAIATDIEDNEQKINHHGKRADAIVKGMLQHARANSGKKEPTDINALADEYLRLSYHGLRAKDKSFNAMFKTDFDENVGNLEVVPQDIGRVLLNLYNNAFYAVNEKKKQLNGTFEPAVSVSTKRSLSLPTGQAGFGEGRGVVIISIKDNGNGIPQKILDKIYQPFFTTKPTGAGTGLGLSLSYDIIKAHGGEIKVLSTESEGAEFIIQLPFKGDQ